jgi:haloalkane dehalogenase
MSIAAVRTPDDRFANLPAWPYAPQYIDDLPGYEGLRMARVDVGPADADRTFLCLHGQPSWSYLYRKMIPIFAATGARVVAPDHFGFGRSDKPVDDEAYTWSFHRGAMLALINRLNLRNVTLVVQDWGGLIGLTLPQEAPERYKRLIVMNTAIAVGNHPGPGFEMWKAYVRANPDFPVGELFKRGNDAMTDAEAAAYDAPYPDATYRAGARRFPELVMVDPAMEGVDDSRRAVQFWSQEWTGQSFMAIGMADPVLGPPAMMALHGLIRGCPPPMEIPEAGHFVQEWGEPVAHAALASFGGQ